MERRTTQMSKQSILITGGCGFIGSNFIHFLNQNYPDIHILNIDKITYAADTNNLNGLSNPNCYQHINLDICDFQKLRKTFQQFEISNIIHFAAESHVDNSIQGPRAFIETNIIGTFNLLECAREFWHNDFSSHRFHHISTDEVFGTLGATGLFEETTPYAPNSPYSASKASSDHLVRSYIHTYGLNAVTTNCSNNYGPRQHKEKLIPTIIRKALSQESIPIYGNGKNIRDWLYVDDHCEGIFKVFQHAEKGENFNFGGECELTNIDLCLKICNILDNLKPRQNRKSYKDLIKYVTDRPGHDFRYAIDISKAKKMIKWHPKTSLEIGLEKTIHWYLNK